jgi:hypothetical protein
MGVGACQYSPAITERSQIYNRAVAEATNQVILLNVVRASQREPRYFSRVASNNATSNINPSLAVTFPFGPLSGGQAVATPQATLQNAVQYDNLDDLKYQKGAMEEIAPALIRQYWNQGIQSDVLGLLFISTIEIPTAELQIIRDVLNSYCTADEPQQKFCGSDRSLAEVEGFGPQVRESAIDQCWTHVPIDRRNGVSYAVYINDPAFENMADGFHPEFCFQIALRALLALGLHPADENSTTPVDRSTPSADAMDPRFRSEMIKLGYTIDQDQKTKNFSVNKKESRIVFTLDPAATQRVRFHPGFRELVLRCDELRKAEIETDAANYCNTPAKSHQTRTATKRQAEIERGFKEAVTKDRIKGTVVPLDSLRIGLGIRSFESTVYYLGEVVRSQGGDRSTGTNARPYFLAVFGRQPWGTEESHYEERLFDLRTGPGNTPSSISVTSDRGVTYWLADYCPNGRSERPDAKGAAANCSIEFPDNESLLVLTLINEIWGLKKEPSSEPLKTISVGGTG